jgi:hypothetical protein
MSESNPHTPPSVFLTSADVSTEIQSHRDPWLQALARDPIPSFDLHPDVLSTGAIALTSWPTGNAPARFALLRPRKLRIRPLPLRKISAPIPGHHFIGEKIIGANTSADIDPFISKIADLIASRQIESLILEDLEINGQLHNSIAALLQRDRRFRLHPIAEPQPHWWIHFPPDPQDYWKKFSGKTRFNLRRAAKKLEHTVTRFTTPDDVPRFLQQTAEISRQSWQARRLDMRIEDTPETRRALQHAASLGAFRSYILDQRGRPIAFALCRQFAGKFDYQEVGYTAEFREFSPGTVLLYRLLEDLIADNPPRIFDFDTGDAEYKKMFGNHQTLTAPFVLTRSTLKYSTLFTSSHISSKSTALLRAWLGKSKPYLALRRLYRR